MKKGIRLFIREHLSYILMQVFVVLFLLTLYWLDGFRNIETALYSIAMSILLIATFLVVRYMLRRRFLHKITQLPQSMEIALQKDAKTAEYAVTEDYLKQLYNLYQQEVQMLYAKQSRNYKFMNQWIHQMKTPVSVLELLLQEDVLDKRSVQEEVDRIKNGLELVLMTARIENFQEDLQVEQVNLRSLVNVVVNNHKRLFITNRVFPQVEIDENLYVMSDSKWLAFVMEQFVTNAVKYTFESGKKVTICAYANEQTVRLQVKDEGIGIPQSDLSRITKAFFTGENGRKTGESTGMGLYIAQEIAQKLGHTLQFTSEVGTGTTAEIIFMKESIRTE